MGKIGLEKVLIVKIQMEINNKDLISRLKIKKMSQLNQFLTYRKIKINNRIPQI